MELRKRGYLREGKSVIVEINRVGEGKWEASLSKMSPGMGVINKQVGKSGWEALMKMAENFKKAGFLD